MATVRLIRISDPGPGLGQSGDAIGGGVALNGLEKSFVQGGQELFGGCHAACSRT